MSQQSPLAAPTAATPTQPSLSANRGWTVTMAALGINLILGSLYAWGVIAKELVTHGNGAAPTPRCRSRFRRQLLL